MGWVANKLDRFCLMNCQGHFEAFKSDFSSMWRYTFPLLVVLTLAFHKWVLPHRSRLWPSLKTSPFSGNSLHLVGICYDLTCGLNLKLLMIVPFQEQFRTVPRPNSSLLLIQSLFLLGVITCRLPTNFFFVFLSFVDSLLRKLTEECQWPHDPGVILGEAAYLFSSCLLK